MQKFSINGGAMVLLAVFGIFVGMASYGITHIIKETFDIQEKSSPLANVLLYGLFSGIGWIGLPGMVTLLWAFKNRKQNTVLTITVGDPPDDDDDDDDDIEDEPDPYLNFDKRNKYPTPSNN